MTRRRNTNLIGLIPAAVCKLVWGGEKMVALLALAAGLQLPPQQLEIASKVAAGGRPECTSYQPDGAVGPCLPTFELGSGSRINGSSAGPLIVFTRAATEKLTRDEFALLAGHEIAHYYLGHGEGNPADELAADRLGAQIACQAGYVPAAGISLFRFFAAGQTHPHRAQRRAAVLSVRCNPQLASSLPNAPVALSNNRQ